jgi:hypothetical protein
MYTEALAGTPMDSPLHIPLQQLHFPLPLSSHPVHINAAVTDFAMDKYSQLLDKMQKGI